MPRSYYCSVCKTTISEKVYLYSKENYGRALCLNHQKKLPSPNKRAPTEEAKKLAKALKKRGWKVELEKWDGYKHIDIAITEVMVNIEVDGLPHAVDPKQALTDLMRNYYSFKKGFLTLRIPNCLVQDDEILESTADYLSRIMKENDPFSELKDFLGR